MTRQPDRLRRFYDELKRRHVIRVGIAYVVVGFAILQGVDLVLPALYLPEWTYRLLVIGVLTMFPIVLVVAWVYDLTRGGLQRTPDLAATEASSAAGATREAAPDPLGPIDSVAILPLTNAGGDPEGEYLSDGITESIINKMASIEGIRVVPRASAFRYKNREVDPGEVSRELRVRALVTGTVQQRGNRLVAQTELVDLATEAQLWGDHYNRPMADIFTVQEEIAEEIARSLRLKLTGQQKARLMRRETENAEAYEAYMRGRHHWNRRTAEGIEQAIRHLQQAIELDPNYALAHAGLADAYNVLGYYNVQDPRDAYPRAKAAARKVLQIDKDVAEAHASLGYALLFFDRSYEEAADELRRAIALNPSYATAHQWYGWYLLVRERFDEMLTSLRSAVELDPLSLIINDHYGYAFFLNGRYDDAMAQINKTLDLDPTYPLAYLRLGNLHAHQGRYPEAIAALERAVELSRGILARGYLGQALAVSGRNEEARRVLAALREEGEQRYVSPLDRALVHAGLGEADAAVQCLGEAFEHRTSDLVRLRALPWPAAVREHPAFDKLVRDLGLVPS